MNDVPQALLQTVPFAACVIDEKAVIQSANDSILAKLSVTRNDFIHSTLSQWLEEDISFELKKKIIKTPNNKFYPSIVKSTQELAVLICRQIPSTQLYLLMIHPAHNALLPPHMKRSISFESFLVIIDNHIIFSDENLSRLIGWSKEEIHNKSIEWITEKVVKPSARKIFNKQLRQPTKSNHILEIVTKDGDTKWIEYIVSHGKVQSQTLYLVNFIDITHQKQTEENLRKIEELYQWVAESSTNGIITTDSSRKILYINKQMANLLGHKPSEIINKKSWVEFLAPQDRDRVITYAKNRRIKGKTAPKTYLLHAIDASGNLRPMIVKTKMIRGTDINVGFFIDLSEKQKNRMILKTIKQHFQTVFENAPLGIAVVSSNGLIEQVNPTFRRIFNFNVNYKKDTNFSSFINRYLVSNDLINNFTLKKDQQFSMIPFRNTDRERFVNISSTWVPEQYGYGGYWVFMFNEISDQLEAKKIMAALPHNILEAHEEEKRKISREIHDTLSQELAVFKMNAQRLNVGESRTPEEKQRLLHQLDGIIERSRNLAADLRPDLLDNLGLIEAIHTYAHQLHKHMQIKINYHTNLDHTDFSEHDNLQLFRIIQEATINAVKHSRASKIEIGISRKNKYYIFLVKDNGIGFNVDTLTENLQGNHLGLRIMQERCSDINAEFIVDSTVGKGTTIKIRYIPR